MRRFRYLVLATLVAFAACDEDSPVDPATQVGTVTGSVTAAGAGIQGVTVSLAGPTSQSATTGADGSFSFTSVQPGNYAVTISGVPADFACAQTSQAVTVVAQQTATVAFTCNLVQTASINVVATRGTQPLPGATITVTRTAPAPAGQPQTVQTGTNGQVSLTGLRSGTYEVSITPPEGVECPVTTQTIQLAVGQAQVVNFACGIGVGDQTVVIQAITTAGGVDISPDALAGQVSVWLGIDEGEQRGSVERVELLLAGQVVYSQTFSQTDVPEDLQAVDFTVFAPINTARFDPETGTPDFLNQVTQLTARVYVRGREEAAHTASVQVRLVNVDTNYVTITPERTLLSTGGLLFWSGDVTFRALPVMYSGHTVASTTVSVQGRVPPAGDFATYAGGAFGTTGALSTVSRVLDSAPFETTLRGDQAITAGTATTAGTRGVGDVESTPTINITTIRGDGQPGPSVVNLTTICDDGTAPRPDLPVACPATGQPANVIRLDNFAPVVGQLPQALRWSTSYPITNWVGSNHTFNVNVGGTQGSPTQVRARDWGTGISGDFFTYRAGETTEDLEAVASPNDLDESFDDNEYVLHVEVQDLAGNSRIRWHDGVTSEGLADNATNRATIDAALGVHRFGVDLTDPGIALASNGFLQDTGDIIENAGGVVDGTQALAELSDETDTEGASPSGFPAGAVQTRITILNQDRASGRAACWVGNWGGTTPSCRILGTVAEQTGTDGDYDFVAGMYTTYDLDGNPDTETEAQDAAGTTLAGPPEDAYFLIEYRAVDAAGNLSDWIEERFIYDVNEPQVGSPVTSLPIAAGQTKTFQAFAADGLDLAAAEGFLAFASGESFRQSVQTYSAFGPPLQATATATAQLPVVGSIQYGLAGGPDVVTNFQFRVLDHARNEAWGTSNLLAVSGTPRDFSAGAANVALDDADFEATETTICLGTTASCGTNETSTTLRFWVEGAGPQITGGPVANPFTRLTFYVGLDRNTDGAVDQDPDLSNDLYTAIANGSVAATNLMSGDVRRYTWSRAVTAAQLIELAEAVEDDIVFPFTVRVHAVGYSTDGFAFSLGSMVITIDDN